MIFRDRHDAGKAPGKALGRYAERPDVHVLGLPRGGVNFDQTTDEELLALLRQAGAPPASRNREALHAD